MATFIVTEDNVYWSTRFEDPFDIACEHNLSNRTELAIVDISPEKERFHSPIDDWSLKVTQKQLPVWWNNESRKRVMNELPKWVASKIVLPGETLEQVCNGRHIVRIYGTVNEVFDGGKVDAVVGSGSVLKVSTGGGVKKVMHCGFVGAVRSWGTVDQVMHGGVVDRVEYNGHVYEVGRYGVVANVGPSGSIHKLLHGGIIENLSTYGSVKSIEYGGLVRNSCNTKKKVR